MTRLGDDQGVTAVTGVMAMVLSMVVVTAMINLIVAQYGRGVVRGALDAGVRAGGMTAASETACEARIDRALDQMLGELRHGVAASCAAADDRVTATATIAWPTWLPAMPTLRWTERAVGVDTHPAEP